MRNIQCRILNLTVIHVTRHILNKLATTHIFVLINRDETWTNTNNSNRIIIVTINAIDKKHLSFFTRVPSSENV